MVTRLLTVWVLVMWAAVCSAQNQDYTNLNVTSKIGVGVTDLPSSSSMKIGGLLTSGATDVLLINGSNEVVRRVLGRSDLPSAIAYEDESNTFSGANGFTGIVTGTTGTFLLGSDTRISNTSPSLLLHDSDAASSEKYTGLESNGGLTALRFYDDALSASSDVFLVDRTGITPDDFRFGSGLATIRCENNGGCSGGSINKKFLTLHAWELWVQTLVAQDVIATIGGTILVAPTTELTRDIVAADTTIYLKHNQARPNDTLLLQANGAFEKMLVTTDAIDCRVISACPTTANDYKYTVTRNRDLTGANDWAAGSAAVNEGNTGDGTIELVSERSATNGGYPEQIVNDAPAIYYRMAETSAGQSQDVMGSGLAAMEGGTQSAGLGVGATAWSSAVDPIWENTGGAGYLTIADTPGLRITETISIEFWAAWQRTVAQTEIIVSKHYQGEYHVQVKSDGTMQFCHGTSAGGGSFTCYDTAPGVMPNDTSTHHYAYVRDYSSSPKRIMLYKDATLVQTWTYTQAVATTTNNVVIGANPTSLSANQFDGYLDEVAVYTYALSGDQIIRHYGARNNSNVSRFHVGPSIIGRIRTSTAAFGTDIRWVIGNLAGTYGYNSALPRYGMASGEYATTWTSIDSTNGWRMMFGDVMKMQFDTLGNGTLDGNLTIGASGIFRTAAATNLTTGTGIYMAGGATPVLRVGIPSGNQVKWDGTNLAITSERLVIDQSGVRISSSSNSAGEILSSYGFTPISLAGNIFGLFGSDTGTFRSVDIRNIATSGSATVISSMGAGYGGSQRIGLSVVAASSGNRVFATGWPTATASYRPIVWDPTSESIFIKTDGYTGICAMGTYENGILVSCP